jgi:hypothetical protein
VFNIDFRHIAYNLTPFFKRRPAFIAWIYSLVRPLKESNNSFVSFANNIEYNLTFTSETNVLERFLNDQFDPVSRGIFITNINEVDFQFFFNKSEGKARTFIFNKSEGEPPFYVYNKSELLQSVNFIINVPVSVVFDSAIMRERVQFYNQAGKNFTIITY